MSERNLTAWARMKKSQKKRTTPLALRERQCSTYWMAKMRVRAAVVRAVVQKRKSPAQTCGRYSIWRAAWTAVAAMRAARVV
jgi:hypothetical protein